MRAASDQKIFDRAHRGRPTGVSADAFEVWRKLQQAELKPPPRKDGGVKTNRRYAVAKSKLRISHERSSLANINFH